MAEPQRARGDRSRTRRKPRYGRPSSPPPPPPPPATTRPQNPQSSRYRADIHKEGAAPAHPPYKAGFTEKHRHPPNLRAKIHNIRRARPNTGIQYPAHNPANLYPISTKIHTCAQETSSHKQSTPNHSPEHAKVN